MGSRGKSLRHRLAPLIGVVFILYFVTGAALPVLPLHVRDDLHFGTFAIGLVTGAQFGAAVIFRLIAGALVDRKGSRRAMLSGCVLAGVAGLVYAVSLIPASPQLSLAALLAGRAVLGAAESLVIVGGQSWALAVAPDDQAGRVIGWTGTALFLGLAAGSPAGSFAYEMFGLGGVAALTAALPVGAAMVIVRLRDSNERSSGSSSVMQLRRVARAVWLPGVAMCLSTASYGVMTAFSTLLFAERGWQPTWLAFTLFAAALTAVRIALGSLTDRLGGPSVAIASVMVQAAGMAAMAIGGGLVLGLAGAILAGAGYALVYPAMGLIAIGKVEVDNRGAAIGVFSAFLDLSLGVSGPIAGLIASGIGTPAIFLMAAGLALLMAPLTWRLGRNDARSRLPPGRT